jgi:hypothetical protein
MGQLSRYSDGMDGRGSITGRAKKFLPYSTASKPDLGLTQPPIQWVPGGGGSLRVKPLGRQADPSPPSSAEFKNGGAIPPLSHTLSWCGAQLIKYRYKFTLFLPVEAWRWE